MKKTAIAALLALSLAGCGGSTMPENIAHRGASHIAPENTVASANAAWEVGADAVEIDIYLSADGRIVVMHDSDTKRTTGESHKIAETSSDVLRSLDAGSFKGAEFAGEKIPFIDEIFATIPNGKHLYIEIKCGPEVIEPLAEMIGESGQQETMRIITFGYETAAAAKKRMPDIPVYWLAGAKKDEDTGKTVPYDGEFIEKARAAGIDGLDLHHNGVTADFVSKAHSEGFGVYVWTVDDMDRALELADMGVDGITTNKPGELAAALKSK